MDVILQHINKKQQTEKRIIISRDKWDDTIFSLSTDLHEVRNIFFNKCVEKIRNNNKNIDIKKNIVAGRAEIVIKAFQLINIIQYIPRYIENENLQDFIDRMFRIVCGKKYKDCIKLASCYLEFGEGKFNKKIYYFSADIGKYICGYDMDSLPSAFPCLASYIAKGLPTEIMSRNYVTESTILVSRMVSQLSAASILAMALCFGDDGFAEEIRKIYMIG